MAFARRARLGLGQAHGSGGASYRDVVVGFDVGTDFGAGGCGGSACYKR